jgi:hypothetical protein
VDNLWTSGVRDHAETGANTRVRASDLFRGLATFPTRTLNQIRSVPLFVRNAEIPGFELSTTSAGRPTIELRSRILDTTLPVLRPRKTAAGVRDVVDSKTWRRDPKIVQARDRFRAAMARIEGAAPNPGGTMMIPMASSAAHAEELVSALRQLADDLESQ